MSTFDDHANFALALVTVAPAPALTGLSLTVDDASLFPTAPFNAAVWPPDVCALASNAEIVRVTAVVGNVFTIVRAQEGTAAKAIAVGSQIANAITVKVIDDIQDAVNATEADVATIFSTGVFDGDAAGGDLAGTYPNPTLAAIGAAAGPVGDATHVAAVSIDTKGRVTALSSVLIAGTAPGGAAGGVLSGTYPNPGFAVDMATQAELDAVSALSVIITPAASARNVIQPTGAAVVPLTMKGFAGQTANLLDFRSSADVLLAAFSETAVLEFGATGDTNLYRSGADALATDDEFDVLGFGRNRIDTLTITGAPTGGSFTIQAGSFVSPALAFNSTAAQVQDALRALPIFGLGGDPLSLAAITSVQCAGGPLPGTPITIELLAPYAALVSNISYTLVNSLTGGAAPTVSTAITTTALPAAASDRVIVTSKGINLPPGGSIRGSNAAGTSYIPLISRSQTSNCVVLWSGVGSPAITLDTNGRIGLGIGNVTPGLAGTLAYGGGATGVGEISIFNRGAGSGITAVTVKAGVSQSANYWMRFIDNAGALVWRILPDGKMEWGSASDTNLYRSAADTLKTDDAMVIGNGLDMSSKKITNVLDPTVAQDAATKAYVDASISGINWKQAVSLASTAALPPNIYANGASGVGATLTGVSVGALTIDGTSPALGARVLIKNEVAGANNGIYTVTAIGSGIAVYVLTRATDFDTSAEVVAGDTVFATLGVSNADTSWVLTTTGTIVIGTTALTFSQYGTATGPAGGDLTGTYPNPTLQTVGSGSSTNIEFAEVTSPATPAANKVRLFARDSGGGKTQLVAKFESGNTVVIAEDF